MKRQDYDPGYGRDTLWNLSLLSPSSSPPPTSRPKLIVSPSRSENLERVELSEEMLRSRAPSQLKKSKKKTSLAPKRKDSQSNLFDKCKPCSVVIENQTVEKFIADDTKRKCVVRLEKIPDPDLNLDDNPLTNVDESFKLPDASQEKASDESLITNSSDDEDLIPGTPQESKQDLSLMKSFYEYGTFLRTPTDETVMNISDSEDDGSIVEILSAKKPPPESPCSKPIKKSLEASNSGPSREEVIVSLEPLGLPFTRHKDVRCSDYRDSSVKGIDLGIQRITLKWEGDRPEFDSSFSGFRVPPTKDRSVVRKRKLLLETVMKPPCRKEVERWLKAKKMIEKEASDKEIHSHGADDPIPSDNAFADFDEMKETRTQVVVRVRQDSDDSLGSEIKCSPTSSPDEKNSDRSSTGDICSNESDRDSPFHFIPSTPPEKLKKLKRNVSSNLSNRVQNSGKIVKKRRISWQDERDKTPDKMISSSDTDSSFQNILNDTQLRHQFAATPEQSFMTKMRAKGERILSQIEGPSSDNSGAFKMSFENLMEAKALQESYHITLMSVELHVQTRQKMKPDPEFDPILAVFVVVSEQQTRGSDFQNEYILVFDNCDVDDRGFEKRRKFLTEGGILEPNVRYFSSEVSMILGLKELILEHDPDILVGYEVQLSSWGYLIERGAKLDLNLAPLISRLPLRDRESKMNEEEDKYNADHTSELHIAGRIVLNVWRLLRSEVAFYSYTFENMMYHVLHERVPKFEFETLTSWWRRERTHERWRVVHYYQTRVRGSLRLLDQLDLIGRNCELARIFGIQFFEVLSRGSQFRVESLMLRHTKRRNSIPVSPSIQQRAKSKAPEYLPLVMEPESRFYCDPVIVLDFQSLYPSIIMAYNYCFSTCVGKVQNMNMDGAFEFGCTELKVSPKRLEKLLDHLNFSPGGVAFVKEHVRKGVLPQMLKEILDTRLMVKKSMKLHKNDKALQRILHARQLGLKLIANVTYGYTSANFSGRMPCIEVGDSVVSKGRETLERAIKAIESNQKWGARVVYGDTDSVFVLLSGKSKDDAFDIGQEIADFVTQDNPKPVKLKFEKVYYPCILQTKKRYVGYMYETKDQKDPVYDAKGIETVRRDGCPAVQKILEKSLRILFETKDVTKVKLFVQRQFTKIIENRASLQDLTFAKEFRGFGGYKPGAVVPALALTRRFTRSDRRAVPRSGERVPYIIVYGVPGQPLIQSVRAPQELLKDPALRPNSHYYISRVIVPPLNRCFSLVGVDVMTWYSCLPKTFRPRLQGPSAQGPTSSAVVKPDSGIRKQGVISRYFTSQHCASCGALSQDPICKKCKNDPQGTVHVLTKKVFHWNRAVDSVRRLCQACTGSSDPLEDKCVSLDCPVLYKKQIAVFDVGQVDVVMQLLDKIDF